MTWKKPSTKRILLIVALFALIVFGGSGVYALLTPLRLTASIAKTRFQVGEPVSVIIVLQDVGLWPQTISLSAYFYLFDFAVYNEEGKEIFRWSYSRLIDGLWESTTFWPTETRTEIRTWNQVGFREEGDLYEYKVSKGRYAIMALAWFEYMTRRYSLESQPIMVTIE